VPASIPAPDPGEQMRLVLEAGTHALRQVTAGPVDGPRDGPATPYRLVPEDRLRSLPDPGGGSRSFYGESGRVPGTHRLERLFFWPLGVPDAGAMRQGGSHATAFVGRRHFDDARLLDERFSIPAPAPATSARPSGDPR